MTKKIFTLLTITFGFFFSLFLAVTFQHPFYISKWVLLFACLGGFGTALLCYLANGKTIQAEKLGASSLKQLALISFALSLAWLVLLGYTPNTLLMPTVKVQLTITPSTSASAPLTSLVAISEGSGTHFFSLKAPEVTYSGNVVYQDRELVISADPAQPANITFEGKTWSERINFSFEGSSRDFVVDFFVVDFFVDGQKEHLWLHHRAGGMETLSLPCLCHQLMPIKRCHSFHSSSVCLPHFSFWVAQFNLLREQYAIIDSSVLKVTQKLSTFFDQIFSILHINEILKTTQPKDSPESRKKNDTFGAYSDHLAGDRCFYGYKTRILA